MAALARFELAHVRVKVWCLTTWLQGNTLVGRGGFEPPNPKEQIYSLPRLATSLPSHTWCRKKESNPQPTDYKSVALPIELFRHKKWWTLWDSNLRPPACKADALTNWAKNPFIDNINNIIHNFFCQCNLYFFYLFFTYFCYYHYFLTLF